MTTLNPEATALDIGRVIQDLAGVLRRNFVPFFILSLILIGIPSVLAGWATLSFFSGDIWGVSPKVGFAGLIRLVASLILQAALIYGTVTDLNGKRASVAQCLSVGLNDFLPVFVIGLLFAVAFAVGCILLVVPGIIIAVIWCVAIPAFVSEHVPVMDSFGRSAQLTEGNRWRIFALFVLFVLAAVVLQAVVTAITGPIWLAASTFGFGIRAVIVQPIVSVFTGLVGSTGIAVLYVELRRLKEGVPVAQLASDIARKDGAAP